jgi:hypothetical protein
MPDLLHQLQVEWLSGGRIKREDQIYTVPLLLYSDQRARVTRSDHTRAGERFD